MTYNFTLKPDFVQDQVLTFEDLQELHDSTVAIYNSFAFSHNPTTGLHSDRQIARAVGVVYYRTTSNSAGSFFVSNTGTWILEWAVGCMAYSLTPGTSAADPNAARIVTAYTFAVSGVAGSIVESQCCPQVSAWPSANSANAAEDVTQVSPWMVRWYNRQQRSVDFATYYEIASKWQLTALGCKFSFRIIGQ